MAIGDEMKVKGLEAIAKETLNRQSRVWQRVRRGLCMQADNRLRETVVSSFCNPADFKSTHNL